MASKRIYGSTANENISSSAVCSSTANVAGNYSLVSVSGRLSRTNTGYTTSGNGTFYLEIDGERYENSGYYEITYNSDTPVITVTDIKIPHESDGKKTIKIKFCGSLPDTTLTSINCAGTFVLDNIPRESTIFLGIDEITAGDPFTVYLERNVSSYTHDVTFKLGNRSTTVKGVGDEVVWTVPKEWQDQFPNAKTSTLSITATTKSGSTTIGAASESLKVNVSLDATPEISVSLAGVNLYWGLLLRTKSKVKVDIDASGKYGAAISRYSIAGGGFNGNKAEYTTGYILQAGDIPFTCTVTDSRGLTATLTPKIKVVPYDPPSILSPEVHRTDETGSEQISGVYIFAKAKKGFSSCEGNNSANMVVQYKKDGGSYNTAVALEDDTAKILGGDLLSNDFYTVKITITDEISSPVSQEFPILTDRFRGAFGTEAAGILRYPPDGGKGLFVTDLSASGIISAEKGIKPEDIEASTETELTQKLEAAYLAMLEDSVKFFNLKLNATASGLFGGRWLIEVYKRSDNYGALFAFAYGPESVTLKTNARYGGAWIGWKSPVF